MQYFPIFVDTKELNCLVVGAGEVAARKVELLLKTSVSYTHLTLPTTPYV